MNELNEQALVANLSESDQLYALAGIAVAIKSSEYGLLQQQLSDKSLWSGYGDRPWPDAADVHGLVAGFVGGFLAGVFGGIISGTGPLGVFVGGLLGGIVGGFGGAIGESVATFLLGGG